MPKHNKLEQWLRDIDDRQRNVVFPATVQNEARFWRNLKDVPWKPSTKAGMAILGLSVVVWTGAILVALFQAGIGTAIAFGLGMILFVGRSSP